MHRFWQALLALSAATLLGCARGPSPASGRPAAGEWRPLQRELEEFVCAKGRIRLGMTKAEVLEQIAKSSMRQWGEQVGIQPPSDAMHKRHLWTLTYGSGTGAAPGGGLLRIEFRDGKVSRIAVLPDVRA